MPLNSINVNSSNTGYAHSIIDLSASGAKFEDLSAALAAVPEDKQKGGMTISFVQDNSVNKYVQYRLMKNIWSVNIDDWSLYSEDILVENPEFVQVLIDLNDKIIEGIKTDGTKVIGGNVRIFGTFETLGSTCYLCQAPGWLKVLIDSQDKVIAGITTDGKLSVPAGIEDLDESVKSVIEILFTNKVTLDKFSENSGHLMWNDSPIEGNGVTQEELNQKLANYSTTAITDGRYASKSLEAVVNEQGSQISDINGDIDSIGQNVETISEGLSELTSPLPAGAITGDNVWTGQNQFMQPVVGVSGTNDNNVALYGQFKNTLYRFEDAADYGLKASNTGILNAQALNAALSGGNKTVIISKPGVYLIGDTILIEDNTTLICGRGVLLKKSSTDFCNVILNKGAETRTFNENISLIGVHISHNNMNSVNSIDSPLYGMRGVIGFLCVRNLYIKDFILTDLAVNAQYALHINTFEHITICNSYIAGEKDGIHLSDGKYFTVRNCRVDTVDDVVAMNSSDWDSSNCVDGTLKYGLIEGCSFNYKGRLLMLVGAFVDWFDGMEIYRGDRVVSNGRVYRAVGISPATKDVKYYSQTQPTIDTYSGTQNDAGGFKWKLMKDEVFYQTNVEDVVIRNCYSVNTGISARADTPIDQGATSLVYNRSLYPTVDAADYPKVKCAVEDCVFETSTMGLYREVNVDASFCNVRLGSSPFNLPTTLKNSVYSRIILDNCDFSKMLQNNYYISSGSRSHVIIRDAKGVDYIKFESANANGRVETNYPCDIATYHAQKKGDITKDVDGTTKIFNNSSYWNTLTN